MEDHPVQLLPEGGILLPGVISHPVDTDVHLSLDGLAGFRQVEGNDVGIIIMLKKVPVDLEEVFICAKYTGKGTEGLPVMGKHFRKEYFQPVPVPERKADLVVKELY